MALHGGPVPLYFQLAQDLRGQIARRLLKPGDAIPTQEQLCAQYGVSRITVRRAVDDLVSENLVTRQRGVGTFVKANSGGAGRSVSLVGSLYEALSYPKGLVISVLRRGIVDSPAWAAEALQQKISSRVYCCETVSRVNDTPFTSAKFYFPAAIGKKIDFNKMDGEKPVAHLVESVIGEPVVRAEQVVHPGVADKTISRLLSIPQNTPLLNVRRIYFTASGKPVEAVSVYYRPDQYRLKIDLLASDSLKRSS